MLDDRLGALDELGVRGKNAFRQVNVVLKPDANVAAGDDRLRHHWHLQGAQSER
jgi:hypothetical protein